MLQRKHIVKIEWIIRVLLHVRICSYIQCCRRIGALFSRQQEKLQAHLQELKKHNKYLERCLNQLGQIQYTSSSSGSPLTIRPTTQGSKSVGFVNGRSITTMYFKPTESSVGGTEVWEDVFRLDWIRSKGLLGERIRVLTLELTNH